MPAARPNVNPTAKWCSPNVLLSSVRCQGYVGRWAGSVDQHSRRIPMRCQCTEGRVRWVSAKSSYQNPRGAQEISGLWPAGRGFGRRSKRAIYLYCCQSRFRHSLSHSQRFSTRWRLLSIHSGQGLRPSMECRSGRGLRRPGVEVLPDRHRSAAV